MGVGVDSPLGACVVVYGFRFVLIRSRRGIFRLETESEPKEEKKIRIEIENRRKKNKANNGIKKKMKKKSGGNTDNEKDFPHGEQFERMSKSTRIYPSRWRFGT